MLQNYQLTTILACLDFAKDNGGPITEDEYKTIVEELG
jgi:hypothetical protein